MPQRLPTSAFVISAWQSVSLYECCVWISGVRSGMLWKLLLWHNWDLPAWYLTYIIRSNSIQLWLRLLLLILVTYHCVCCLFALVLNMPIWFYFMSTVVDFSLHYFPMDVYLLICGSSIWNCHRHITCHVPFKYCFIDGLLLTWIIYINIVYQKLYVWHVLLDVWHILRHYLHLFCNKTTRELNWSCLWCYPKLLFWD